MDQITINIVEGVIAFIAGAFVNHIFLVTKFRRLSDQIDELISKVTALSARDKTIDKLVDKYMSLEERVSTTEAKIDVLTKYVERVEQEIIK